MAALARILPEVAGSGNKNLISDAGVAALLCSAAFEAAALNVAINLKALAGEASVAILPAEMDSLRQAISADCAKTLDLTRAALA